MYSMSVQSNHVHLLLPLVTVLTLAQENLPVCLPVVSNAALVAVVMVLAVVVLVAVVVLPVDLLIPVISLPRPVVVVDRLKTRLP